MLTYFSVKDKDPDHFRLKKNEQLRDKMFLKNEHY
jgi:hypothetical protein